MKRFIYIEDIGYQLQRQAWPVPSAGSVRGNLITVDAENKRLPPDETLFHELFHACEHRLVEQGKIVSESTERYVEAMAYLFYHTLKRNGFLSMNVEWDQLDMFDILKGSGKE